MRLTIPRISERARIPIAFACVYLFWGSTYGAIRVAGLHLAAPLVAGLRCVLSAGLLCGICVARGTSLRVPGRTAWRLAVVGLLFMSVNNVFLTWAEKTVPSGYAALVIAMIPILVAVIEAGLAGGETMNAGGWAGTLLGAVGMLALLWPSLHGAGGPGGGTRLAAFGMLVLAALAFAVGSILARRWRFTVDTFVATAWQIGVAGVVNTTIAAAGGNFRTAVWTRAGVGAIVYLAIFGSLVGLTAYTYLLKHVAVTKVATYAFVNPVVAVLIGVLTLDERLTGSEMVGMVTIVGAVALVIYSRGRRAVGVAGRDAA